MEDKNPKLAYWLRRLTEEELPALSLTASQIAEVASNDQSHLSKLADIILKDPAMTMHILRLTDSAYHIPRKNRQNTISRALVMLGVNEVKSICMSIAVFDPLMQKGSHKELTLEIARAFHAAVQARYFAVMRGDPASEEVFTTALLYHLGEMIFWSFAGKEIDSLRQELKRKDIPRTEAEKNVLGFELNELTAALGRKWGLGRLLEDSVSAEQMDNPRLKTVRLSHQLVKLVEQGWETEETKNLLQEIVAFTGLPQTALMPALRRNTEEAVQLAEAYGASAASERIARLVETPADDEDLKELERQLARTENAEQPPVRDAEYQLKVLRKLSDTIIAGSSVSEVLELVLDGIYRGIGMDRALFALLSPNKKYLRAKSVAGAGRDILARKFKLEVNEAAPTIFDKVICEQDAFWIKDRSSSAAKELIPQLLEEIIGDGPFFVAPAVVDNQAIGIFFADRRPSMRELDEECFDAFRQFAMQANLALEYLGKY